MVRRVVQRLRLWRLRLSMSPFLEPTQLYVVPDCLPHCFDFGPLRLWCRHEAEEYWLASKIFKDGEDRTEEPEEDRWSRLVPRDAHRGLRYLPTMPDRPVVISPERTFELAPGAKARVFVRCPAWIRVVLSEPGEQLLADVPSAVLSSTWFGQFTEGELCYQIKSSARRVPVVDKEKTHLIICPLQLENSADEVLKVEKLCLRVGGLGVYSHGGALWASETHVAWRGHAGSGSEVEIQRGAPPEAAGAALLTPPRDGVNTNFVARTFESLRQLSSLSFGQ